MSGSPSFEPAESFAFAAAREFDNHRRRILARVPEADVRHIGGTAVSGALTKGDLDIQVRVPQRRFRDAVGRLRGIYEASHSDLWGDEFATFVSPSGSLPEETSISVVVIGSSFDRNGSHVWSRLGSEADLLEKYNAIKMRHAGKAWSGYEAEKDAFFAEVSNS
jgi:GrpB-like predicted nucleotidyltransferase (UPF0157 family)